jgi:hypothetical protein
MLEAQSGKLESIADEIAYGVVGLVMGKMVGTAHPMG